MNEQENKKQPETEKNDTVFGVNENSAEKTDVVTTRKKSAECCKNKDTYAAKSNKSTLKSVSARTKTRLLIVIVLVGAMLLGLVAFLIINSILANRPPEFATVRDRFVLLIEGSIDLNQVVFGEGLPVYARMEKNVQTYTVEFNGEEETLRYYAIKDETYGTVISYEYQIQGPVEKNENGINVYTYYDAETGERLPEYQQGAARFVQKSTEEREGYVHRTDKYYYYRLENYENPDLVYAGLYSGAEDENYDYVRFDAKYRSTTEIKDAISSIYADSYISYMYEILFDGTIDLRDQVIQALYIDYEDTDSGSSYLMRSNTSWEWKAIPTVVYDFSTMYMDVSRSNAKSVCVVLKGYEKGNESQRRDYEIWFAREDGAWYLDSPTY